MFRDLGIAACRFSEYPVFLQNRKRRLIGFGFFIALLYFLLTIVVPVVRFQVSTGGIGQIMRDYIPDFKLSNGELWVAEPVEYEDDGMLVMIDTSSGFFFASVDELQSQLGSYQQVILMDSEKMIAKYNGEVSEIYFADTDLSLTREDAADYIARFTFIIGIIIIILLYIWITLTFFFGILIVSLIAMIVASCTKTTLTFGQIYAMAIYSRVLPLLIKAALSLFSIRIPFFIILNFGISVFILYLAFGAIKNRTTMNKPPMEFQVDESGSYIETTDQAETSWERNQD
ncbi:MAG: DUF1189 domain-containing protein [Lachnospiraceae bacterium]